MSRMKDLIKIFIIVALVGVGAKWYANYKTTPAVEDEPSSLEESEELFSEEAPIEDILDLSIPPESALPDLGPESKKEPEAVVSPPSSVSLGAKNSLRVVNQKAGNTVLVADLNLENAGWVAVHEEREGKPGNVLGAAWFPAGKNDKVVVELLRPTLSSKVYYAMLHQDALGDKLYASGKDLPLNDANGNPIMLRFQAN